MDLMNTVKGMRTINFIYGNEWYFSPVYKKVNERLRTLTIISLIRIPRFNSNVAAAILGPILHISERREYDALSFACACLVLVLNTNSVTV